MTDTDLQKEAAQLILELHEAFGNSAFAIETDKVAQLSNRVHALAEKLKPKPALPPIPPGSRFFIQSSNNGLYWDFLGRMICLGTEKVDSKQRFIIAAVAIEEWLQTQPTDPDLTTDIKDLTDVINQWREWRDKS